MGKRLLKEVCLHLMALTCFISTVSAEIRLAGGAQGWDQNSWRVTVDGVMGGKSSGRLRYADGAMIFDGTISLDGGGFSSVRRSLSEMDLSSYAGIVVELDSQVYSPGTSGLELPPPLGLHLQLHDRGSSYGYAAAFARPLAEKAGEVAQVFLPLAAFDRATRSGWKCSSCELDTKRVDGIDVYVLFQSGPFEVRLRSVTAVKEVMSFPVPSISLAKAVDVEGLLKATIKSGSSMYDKDYEEICVAIYSTSLHAVMTAKGPSLATRGVACLGLNQAWKSSKSEKAFALRYTIDAILADLGGAARTTQRDWLLSPEAASDAFESCSQQVDSTSRYTPLIESSPVTTPPTSENTIQSFEGPFEGMGITGWNDLEIANVEGPTECATKCLGDPRCLSFDYGARGTVKGECWLSTANRASVGSAFKIWEKYDYYELKSEADVAMMKSKSNDCCDASKASRPLIGMLLLIQFGFWSFRS